METESAKRTMMWDVIEFDGPALEDAITGAPAKHALVFSRAWHEMFGCMPSATVHNRYCEGKLPASALLNPSKFAHFVSNVMKLPCVINVPDMTAYAKSLEDQQVLYKETLCRIVDRYRGGPYEKYENLTIAKAHALLRANADMNEIDMVRNAATGHHVGLDQAPLAMCRREAWRSVMSRDMLFAHRAAQSSCLFVDASVADQVHVAVEIAKQMASATKMPITIMSDCSKTLTAIHESVDFYHYPYHVPCVEAYMAMPRLFQGFVLMGGSGERPPLCRHKGKSWHYLTGRKTPPKGTAYVVIADTIDACIESAQARGRLSYFIPQLLGNQQTKTIKIGVHPDTIHLVTGIDGLVRVPPEQSSMCEIYVSCVSNEGIAACMAAGSVAVGKDFVYIDDGVNGFLSRTSEQKDINAAVRLALTCDRRDIGSEASRVSILHGAPTFRWLWRNVLAHACPLETKVPKDAVLLHDRFMVISASLRFRQIARCRATEINRRAVMFMDNRKDPSTGLAVLLSLINLKSGWSVIGFVTKECRPFYESFLGYLGDVRLIEMHGFHKDSFFIEQYNARMKSLETWLTVADTADTVLTVQGDGLLVRSGLESHPVMQHDYAGAPWKSHPYLEAATKGNLVGNGGFSLRSVSEMVRVCREHSNETAAVYPMAPLMSEAEDVFFARRVHEACPVKIAMGFSMEQTSSPDALGYHRFWMYHPVDYTIRVLEKALQETAPLDPFDAAVEESKKLADAANTVKTSQSKFESAMGNARKAIDELKAAAAKAKDCEEKMKELELQLGVSQDLTTTAAEYEAPKDDAEDAEAEESPTEAEESPTEAEESPTEAEESPTEAEDNPNEAEEEPVSSNDTTTEQNAYTTPEAEETPVYEAPRPTPPVYQTAIESEPAIVSRPDGNQHYGNQQRQFNYQQRQQQYGNQQRQFNYQQRQQQYGNQQGQQQTDAAQIGGDFQAGGGALWYKNQRSSAFDIVGFAPIISGLAITLVASILHPHT